jgi:hypothetical protein
VYASYDLSVHKTAELRQVFHEIPTRPQLISLSTSFRYFVVVVHLVRDDDDEKRLSNLGSNLDARTTRPDDDEKRPSPAPTIGANVSTGSHNSRAQEMC